MKIIQTEVLELEMVVSSEWISWLKIGHPIKVYIDQIQKDVAKDLGLAGKAATVLDTAFKALGLNNPFGEALEKTKAAS